MNHKNKVIDETQDTIITRYGQHPSKLDDDDNISFVTLEGPQATSTVGTKKSRRDIIQEYLKSVEDIVESRRSDDLKTGNQLPAANEKAGMRPMKNLGSVVKQHSKLQPTNYSLRDTCGSESSRSLSFINVDEMNSLSESKFLVDHTQLLTKKTLETPRNQIPVQALSTGVQHSDDEYDTECAAQKFPRKELENFDADMSDNYESDLSQGALNYDKQKKKDGFGGLPSFLLERNESLLREAQISQEKTPRDCPFQSKVQIQNESSFCGNNLNFNGLEVSARSTMVLDGLEKSKLLSGSCNSLGSLEGYVAEDFRDDVSSQSCIFGEGDSDPFPTEQIALASFLKDEIYQTANKDLDEDEKENAKMNIFMKEEACTGSKQDDTFLSGIYEIKEITVRPSWIPSPDKELLGPGNKMNIDDYLMLRSGSLGKLGDDDDDFGGGGVDIGMDVHSPPGGNRAIQLVEMSAVNNMSYSYLQPEGEMMEVEFADHLEQSQTFKKNNESSVTESSWTSTIKCQSSRTGSSSSGSTTFEVSSSSSGSEGAVPKNRTTYTSFKNKDEADGKISSVQDNITSNYIDASFAQPPPVEVNCAANKPTHLPGEEKVDNHVNEQLSEQIRQILSDPLMDKDPQALVKKIIQLRQTNVELHETLDKTDLDISSAVLELREKKEALKIKLHQKENKDKHEKENLNITSKLRDQQNMSRLPLHPTTIIEKKNINQLPNKHMEKLKAHKTSSAPENLHLHRQLRDKLLDTKLGESVMDESVRGIPYKSRILEDSQKSHLVSFHDSTSSGFDSSTPCAPRSLNKQHLNKPNQLSRIGGQLYIEDKRPVNNTAIQRPLPKMGLGSSLVRISGTDNIYAVNSHNVLSLQSSRSETTVYPNSDGSSISDDSSNEEAVRSSSMPSGLQALGVASSLYKPLNTGNQPAISPRQHQSQEIVSTGFYRKGLEERVVVLPQRVEFSSSCILGISSENIMTFRNIKNRWVELSIRLMQETINNTPVMTSALFYKASYFVEPQKSCDIKLSLCSQFAGSWEAVMEVQVMDIGKGSGTVSDVSIHTVILSALIEEPCIQLSCEGEDEVNFDIVPESCIVCREVTIINQSLQPIPVVLTLQKVAATAPVFFWDMEENETCKVVSPVCLACELPPSDAEKGPSLRNFRVYIKAPHLDRVKVDESGIFQIRSQLQVQIDSPTQPTIIIATLPVKAFVGAVHLQTQRVSEPLIMETTSDKSCTVSIPVKNLSTFPIHLSIEPRDHKDVFSPHPNLVVIQPHSLSSVNIAFTPKGKTGSMETVLLMCVEPKGNLYSVIIIGKSAAPAEVTGALIPLHQTLSAPLKSQADLSTALESTKSRIVFGTVGVGEKTWQKVVIRNSCVSQALSLVIGVRGSKAFQICELGCDDGKNYLNAVLEPCQELSLCVFFIPTSVEACSASLIFKPRGVTDPIKFTISLQGYGGRSKLRFVDIAESKPLLIRDISTQQSAMFHTALANTGDRDMFLKILVYQDEKCTELVSKTDILIQPSDFVLKPKENRDVIIMVHGSPQILGKTPGCIGFLVIISGDEILRRRFRRHTNKKVRTRRVNDPSLMLMSWNEFFSGEKESENEEIGLPLQPEDTTVFYNSCSRIQVQLNGERQSNDEASSTVFACLDAEETVNSIANLSILPDRINDGGSSLVQKWPKKVSSSKLNREIQDHTQSWDVFPQSLSIPSKDSQCRTFVVVNFTNKVQMLEVTSSSQWLHIEPREAILGSLGTVQVVVRLIQSRMPWPIDTSIIETLQIMCENEVRSATITVTADDTGSVKASDLPKVSPSVIVTLPPHSEDLPPTPVYQKPPSKIPSQSVQSSDSLQSSLQSTIKPHTVKGNLKNTQPMSKGTMVNHVNSGSFDLGSRHKEVESSISLPVENCLVELVTSSVIFPSTAVSKENMMKVKLRNLARTDHLVTAEVTNLPFAIRHHQFIIKSEHFVTIPVYFRPLRSGIYNGYLRLTVVNDQKVLTVNLSGTAV